MKWIKAGVALLAVLTMSAQVLGAQQRDRRGQNMTRSPLGAEQMLRVREQLGLTGDQIAELEALRKETLEGRLAQMNSLMELRSRVRAGDATTDEMRAAMSASREAAQARNQEYRDRINGVLTEEQRSQLPSIGRAMAGRRGFQPRDQRGFRGQGQRGQRGFRPQRGFRGRAPAWNGGGRGMRPGQRGFRRGRRPPDSESDVK